MANKVVPAIQVKSGKYIPFIRKQNIFPNFVSPGKFYQHVLPPGMFLNENSSEIENLIFYNSSFKGPTKSITELLKLGLTAETYIVIEYYNESDKNIILEFGRSDEYHATCIKPLFKTPGYPPKAGKVGIIFRDNAPPENPPDSSYPNSDIWGNNFDPECFKNINLSTSTGSMKLKRIRIVLNSVNIINYIFSPPITVSQAGFDFSQAIITAKHDILLSYLYNNYSDSNGILWRAAEDLGSGYRWAYNFVPGQGNFFGWCCDFAAYIINLCTDFNITPEEGLWDYFINRNKAITPQNCSYENLPSVVKPGYLIRIGNNIDQGQGGVINHCTLFVRWGDFDDNEGKFNPNQHINYFIALGANRKYYVCYYCFAITDNFQWVINKYGEEYAKSHMHLVWDRYDWHSDDRRICRTDNSRNLWPLTKKISPFYKVNPI